MLRGLITLLLLANLTAGNPLPSVSDTGSSFSDSDLLEVHRIPVKNHEMLSPDIQAKSALVMDVASGVVLFDKDSDKRLAIASLTKIMTAVLILESHDLDDVVTVDENYAAIEEDEIGVKIWLQKGEKITVGNLLTALLVRSAGDAAYALAKYHSGSVEAFVDAMNEKTKVLNLQNTHFTNPIGLDDDGHYSSAFDLAILAKYALNFPAFRNIIRIKEAEIKSVDGGITHSFKTTNYLLYSYLDIEGGKTGTTDEAGESVMNVARSPDGHEIIAIILDSPDRFQENKSIIDWTFRSYSW